MKSIEVTGKNVKDAIAKGVAELGVDSADVDIQVLEMGTPGLFGMFGKPAKVRLTVKEQDPEFEMPVFSLDAGNKKDKPKKESKPKAESKKETPVEEKKVEEAPAEVAETEVAVSEESTTEKHKPRRRRHRSGNKENANNATETGEPAEKVEAPAPIEVEPFVATAEEELSETAKKARDFLKELTVKMGVPAEIAVMETSEQLRMVLSGENMSILIGRRGETLDALQYLTSLTVNRDREDYLRISLDTENYRAKREEALRKLAIRMAARCKKSGRRVALEPMNPYERRVLHSALQADPEVETHSEGEEPYRRVIITLK